MITVDELCKIKKYTPQYARKIARENKIESVIIKNSRQLPQYFFEPEKVLNEHELLAYMKSKSINIKAIETKKNKIESLEQFTQSEREEIGFWIDTIKTWQEHRNAPHVVNKADVDKMFVASAKLENPEVSISIDILYNRWRAYREERWQDLIDNRGKHLIGKSRITPEMWSAFTAYYLNESKPSVLKCYEYMKCSIQLEYPEQYTLIPHDATFRRKIKSDLPKAAEIMGREGLKAYLKKEKTY